MPSAYVSKPAFMSPFVDCSSNVMSATLKRVRAICRAVSSTPPRRSHRPLKFYQHHPSLLRIAALIAAIRRSQLVCLRRPVLTTLSCRRPFWFLPGAPVSTPTSKIVKNSEPLKNFLAPILLSSTAPQRSRIKQPVSSATNKNLIGGQSAA